MIPFFAFAAVFAEEPFFAAAQPAGKLFVSEKLTYKVKYLKIPVGEGIAEIAEIVPLGDRKAYHIRVRVRSYPILDLVRKVRGEYHSFIDAEKLYSLGYEKKLSEGKDRAAETAEIPAGFQDEISCGYWFRMQPVGENSSVMIPVRADGKNWNMEVKTGTSRRMKIKGVGEFVALEVEPLMEFRGFFSRRGRARGWVSLDERRIPLKMKVKVPVLGNVTAELSRYEAGKSG